MAVRSWNNMGPKKQAREAAFHLSALSRRAGNGYAFLKLYRRTNDPIWLDRARQFAMTAIVQYRGSQVAVGRGRYSLWTGDVGLAIYLWDCITEEPRFPTIDVF